MTSIYVISMGAMSLDGYIDDQSSERLILSNPEDFDLVDAARASCDAILVGAETLRSDDPRLLLHSQARRQERLRLGKPGDPMKITLTRSGRLDPGLRFFTQGNTRKLVYCSPRARADLHRRLGSIASVVSPRNEPVTPTFVLQDLEKRNVERLVIEGGTQITTAFLTAGLVDEIRISLAPFFVGDAGAPRFVGPGDFPHGKNRRMQLEDVQKVGDMAVLRYRLNRRK